MSLCYVGLGLNGSRLKIGSAAACNINSWIRLLTTSIQVGGIMRGTSWKRNNSVGINCALPNHRERWAVQLTGRLFRSQGVSHKETNNSCFRRSTRLLNSLLIPPFLVFLHLGNENQNHIDIAGARMAGCLSLKLLQKR
jgi:hypothetical protein